MPSAQHHRMLLGSEVAFLKPVVKTDSLLAVLSNFWTGTSTRATETTGWNSEGNRQMKAENVQGGRAERLLWLGEVR